MSPTGSPADEMSAQAQTVLEGGDRGQAADLFRKAGRLYASAGCGAEADRMFARYFDLSQDLAIIAEAAEHQQAGDIQVAIRLYRAVLSRNPGQVDAWRLLGVALSQEGRFEEAETALRRAVDLAPDFAFAWNNLGSLLTETGRAGEAVDTFRHALKLDPGEPQALFNLGNALAAAGDQTEAAGAYRAVLQAQPRHPGALIGLGHVLKTIGHQDEAITAYRDCLAVNPVYGEVWWSLANLKTYRFSDAEVSQMQGLLDQAGLSDAARVSIEFALGKAFEDRKAYETAFAYYADGNARQRASVAYDPVMTETVNDRIINVFDARFLASMEGSGHPDPAPIFILGLPRSGSTLIEQILASHSLVDGTSELADLGKLAVSVGKYRSDDVTYPEAVRDLGRADFAALGRAYIARTNEHRAGAPYFTDKMPNNFPSIGLIRLILPHAKVIDARRHPLDSCMGAFKQLFAQGQTFTYDLFELGEYYRQYVRMMDWWDTVLPGFVLRMNYEDMVLDQAAQTRRLLDFCGLPFEAACLNFHETDRAVKTASSEQVRQPLHAGGLQTWRRFEVELTGLKDQLADILDDLPERVRQAGR
jgi:cytochrome c-type biogenesis protein CcmH/NrfG